jgi:hypothetical protein
MVFGAVFMESAMCFTVDSKVSILLLACLFHASLFP